MIGLDPGKSTGNIEANKAVASSIDAFEVLSNKTKKQVSILPGIVNLSYYESIRQSTVRLNVVYADSGAYSDATNNKSVMEGLPLVGSEKCAVKFRDNNGTTLEFVDKLNNNFYINSITPLSNDTRKSMISLDLVSKEFIINEKGGTRVVERHDGKISDTINKIFKSNIKTKKKYSDNIEETENNFNFIPNNKKPMYIMDWLSKKSVPKGKRAKSAGFFFWETAKGFHYRSIDWLLDKEKNVPKISIIFNDTVDNEGKDIPEGYNVKAIEFTKDNKINVQERFKMGFQSTRIIMFNPFNGYYEVVPTEAKTAEVDTAGKNLPLMNEELNYDEQGKNYTRTTYYVTDTGTLNSGDNAKQQLEKSSHQNFDFKFIENQAIRRYNQLFSSQSVVTIPGNFSLHAGDSVFIDDASLQVDKTNSEVDKEHGGMYVISDLVHYLDNTGTWTKMNVIRDSFGRKGKPTDSVGT